MREGITRLLSAHPLGRPNHHRCRICRFVRPFIFGALLLLVACTRPVELDEDRPISGEAVTVPPALQTEGGAKSPGPETDPQTDRPSFSQAYVDSLDATDREVFLLSRSNGWRTDFNMAAVPLSEFRWTGVDIDAIEPVDEPFFARVTSAPPYMRPREPVISIELAGVARAYPLAIMMWHEIVNDVIADIPVVVTFCPLCNSAIVFDRTVRGQVLRFGVSGMLRNSDLVMWDDATDSWWQQITGEAMVGAMTGTRLSRLPAAIVAWETFVENFPEGEVMLRPENRFGFKERYDDPPYAGYDDVATPPFLFDGPVDGRLPATARVLAVIEGDTEVAYPYKLLAETGVVNDRVGRADIVIFFDEGTLSPFLSSTGSSTTSGSAVAFHRMVNGRRLTFRIDGNDFVDLETGSRWNLLGRAVSGDLQGATLKAMKHSNEFWFAWVIFHPDTELRTYTPQMSGASEGVSGTEQGAHGVLSSN